MSNADSPVTVGGLGAVANAIINAMYSIFGVLPSKDKSNYVFQHEPYPIVVPASNTNVGTVQVSRAGAFVMVRHAIYDDDDARDYTLTWTHTGSSRRLTSRNNGGHVQNMGGTAERPFIYPQAEVFDGGVTISLRIEALTANARNIFWDLVGWRAWDIDALDLTRRS